MSALTWSCARSNCCRDAALLAEGRLPAPGTSVHCVPNPVVVSSRLVTTMASAARDEESKLKGGGGVGCPTRSTGACAPPHLSVRGQGRPGASLGVQRAASSLSSSGWYR